MNKKILFPFFVSIFVFLIASCNVTVEDSEDEGAFEEDLRDAAKERGLSLPLSDIDFKKMPMSLQEFEMTYEVLDLFYLYAHSRHELGKRNDYYGVSKNILDYRNYPEDYSDIYYMFDQMSCPFTNYFDPSFSELIADALFYSDYGVGFGIRLDTIEQPLSGSAVILNVFPEGPAYQAGLKDGDTIVSIDNKAVTRRSVESIEELSKDGDEFEFIVARGETQDTVKVTAKKVTTPTVFVNYRGDIPMITITEFTDTTTLVTGTYGEFKEALKQTAGAKATIINLADNGGGSVDHCEPMAAEFLSDGTLLGYSTDADIDSAHGDFKQKIDTIPMMPSDFGKEGDGIAKDRYVVFIQNGGTASCSELMISSVTAARNAPVVGTRSYGKGIGQYYFETPAGGYAGVTSTQFFDQNMDTYHTFGIEPDVVKQTLKEAVDEAFRIAEEGTMVRTAGYSDTPTGHFPSLTRKSGKPQFNRRDHFGAFKMKKAPIGR
jgi:C-terminal peptidase prc